MEGGDKFFLPAALSLVQVYIKSLVRGLLFIAAMVLWILNR